MQVMAKKTSEQTIKVIAYIKEHGDLSVQEVADHFKLGVSSIYTIGKRHKLEFRREISVQVNPQSPCQHWDKQYQHKWYP